MAIYANRRGRRALHPVRDLVFTPEVRDMFRENYTLEGKTEVERGQYGNAENFFHAAIEQAEEIGLLTPGLADSLNELAILYAKQHKYERAERIFQRSLGVAVAALGPEHPEVATILKNIGILKTFQKQFDEADLLLNRSLSLATRILGHEHPTVAVTMRTIALFQAVQEHYGEAERLIRCSLEIAEKTLGSEHPEVAASRKVFAQVVCAGRRNTEKHQTATRVQDESRICCGS